MLLAAHAPGFHHVGEFTARMGLIGGAVEAAGLHCRAVGPNGKAGSEDITIVIGDIDALVRRITVVDRQLRFADVPVAMATNANLLPALARAGSADTVVADVFIDGPIVADRARQQRIADGTGISPLQCEVVADLEEAMNAVAALRTGGTPAVAKINGGSGGHGIVVLGPELDVRSGRDPHAHHGPPLRWMSGQVTVDPRSDNGDSVGMFMVDLPGRCL